MSDYDWYLSPADRFQYETDFKKYAKSDHVTLQDLDPLFHQSRISTNDFIQIWQLIDIKYEQELNETQFVYFMHVLWSKRRGFAIPFALPLNIKELFLKEEKKESKIYQRTLDNARDRGSSLLKNDVQLDQELKQLVETIGAATKEEALLQEKLKESHQSVNEAQMILNHLSSIPPSNDSTEFDSQLKRLEELYSELVLLSSQS